MPICFIFSSLQPSQIERSLPRRATTCKPNTPNIPNEALNMTFPSGGEEWVIRFGTGHRTINTAAACSTTLDVGDYYWEVSNKNIAYNTCTTIDQLLGSRLPARAAIDLSGQSGVGSVDMYYTRNGLKACGSGSNVFCDVPGKPSWTCLSYMYSVDHFSVS